MKKISVILLALVAIAAWGCQGGDDTKEADSGSAKVAQTSGGDTHGHPHEGEGTSQVVYCGKCGQEKGTEACCKADAEMCSSCGMAKGSPLCCVDVPDEMKGKDFCQDCGWPKGHENCCKEGAEVCGDCGMHKGSPLCCEIKKDNS